MAISTPFKARLNYGAASRNYPLTMGRVALTVHDLDYVADFYESAVGLHRLRADGETVELGAGDHTLVELRRDMAARRRSQREAGLFHVAILVRSRTDLANWLKHAVAKRLPLLGASDHKVSDALYVADPEGNAVEIYADQPAPSWRWTDGQVEMATDPLDLDTLLARANDTAWTGMSAQTVIGHVHLQVGAINSAEQFYADTLGLGITCRYPGGTFYAAPGYHHHIATNVWNSRNAVPRGYPSTGLADLEIFMTPQEIAAIRDRAPGATSNGEGLRLVDPWNTAITLNPLSTIPATKENEHDPSQSSF